MNTIIANKDAVVAWLLEENDPGARFLAMKDLLRLPRNDPQMINARQAAYQQGQIFHILERMDPEGYWVKPGPGYGPKYKSSVWALLLLAQLGADVKDDPRIGTACNYMIENALAPGGQFAYNGAASGTIDCLQGNLIWALKKMSFDHPRLQSAYEWMARTVTGEGMSPASERKAALRYFAYKCGPNFACGANLKQPCAWGAVKVMMAFGLLEQNARTPMINQAIQMGIDFLLGTDPVNALYPHGENAKPSRDWWLFGFPVFYITDMLQIVEALVELGYGQDARLQNAIQYILSKQDEQGRWPLEYDYAGKTWRSYGKLHEPNKWVTMRVLKVLAFIKTISTSFIIQMSVL